MENVLRTVRILVLAALAVAAAASCPTPIDEELLLVVDDGIRPVLAITSPIQNSAYRYSVSVTGTMRDSSQEEGDEAGYVRTLAFSGPSDPALKRTVTFDRDGSFTVVPADPTFQYDHDTGSFSFTVDATNLRNMQVFYFAVEDLNGNRMDQVITVLPDAIGPNVSVTQPTNGSAYPLLLIVRGSATNSADDTGHDKIDYLSVRIDRFEHALNLELLTPTGDLYQGEAGTPAQNFWFNRATGEFEDRFNLADVKGTQQLTMEVKDVRDAATSVFLSLFDNNTGPEIILNDATHPCPSVYSSDTTTSIAMLGWVDVANLEPGTTRYIVEPNSGVPRDEVTFAPDGAGEFGFTFNPLEPPVLVGKLTVHVYAEDTAGRVTDATHTIYDDPVDPYGTFSVAGAAQYATSPATSLTFAIADDSSGMNQMRFNNDGRAWTEWETYSGAAYAWTLSSTNGTRTVNAQFNDKAGNVIARTDTIFLDTVPPTVSTFVINDGDAYTTSTSATLTIAASDPAPASGLYQMRFSDDGTNWSAWQAYATSKAWTLPGPDGTHTVYAEFSDNAGNVRAVQDGIVLDRQGPTGTLVINGGDAWTGSKNVTLTLSANDATSGVYQMRLRNDTLSGSWEAWAGTKSWTLRDIDGTRTVWLDLRDNAGNITSDAASDTIGLDTTAPSVTLVITDDDPTTTTSVTLSISANDGTGSGTSGGSAGMRLRNDGESFPETWQTIASSMGWTLRDAAGSRTVYIELRDAVGNVGSDSDSITYDPD